MSAKKLLKWKKGADSGEAVTSGAPLFGKRSKGADLLFGRYSNRLGYNDLMEAESELGRTLFGPIPEGHRREFFAYKDNVWVWYESWTDTAGVLQSMTIRYEVRPAGVYKLPTGGNYTKLEGAELDNFVTAARSYYNLVKQKLYY